MESDEDDFVFYGTPIEREDDSISRKKKAIAESSGQLRALPAWKQEVRDEEGRRRFHGAFTGGYSAGYYDTVGSKEGWAPQSFKSSRKSRAEFKEQNILNFLDEDEKTELEGCFLGTTSQFDTFGFTAAEIARKQAEKEQKQRPSIIPGPAPDEIVVPATESVGVKLLMKMGWSRGRSIKDSHSEALYDARRQARRAFLAFSSDDPKLKITGSEPIEGDVEIFPEEPVNGDAQFSKSTPVYVLNPKQDLHGLGFDPYKHAPEFREKKRSRLASKGGGPGYSKNFSTRDSLFGLKSGKAAPGFGIGALEELDVEDEDVYATGYEFEDAYVQEVEEPSTLRLENQRTKEQKDQGDLRGFRVASNSDFKMERFEAPLIPKDFVPHHEFSGPLNINRKSCEVTPPDVPPPGDGNLKLLIEGVANLVAKCGKLYEDLSREKNQSNPLFNFLSGGTGHEYYARKLWEAQQKHKTSRQLDGKMPPSVQRLTAESRGQILGEKPLEKSSQDLSSSVSSTDIHLQFNLTDTFTESASLSELVNVEKPFKDDPTKQERFEQFLKEKYKGGLRSASSSLASDMSEAARAQERLSFEAAAEAIEKGRQGRGSKPLIPSSMDFIPGGVMQFTSGEVKPKKDLLAEDILKKKMYPKREEFQWRPSPLLCKRFDLIDPYMGKPPPAPRIRSKMDTLIFTSDSVKGTKVDGPVTSKKDISSLQQPTNKDITKSITENETEEDVEVENIERPVDLYKAIFSDDSDDEGEDPSNRRVENQEKKAEVANTALSRLIAGDFLESLGKELGIEVPPDMPYPTQKSRNVAHQKDIVNEDARTDILKSENNSVMSLNHDLPYDQQHIAHDCEPSKGDTIDGNMLESGNNKTKGTTSQDNDSSSEEERSQKRSNREKYDESRKDKTPVTQGRDYSSSSSLEEERSRKRSRHQRHKRRDAGSHSSSDDDRRDRHSSRSKGRRKGSSREKSRSEKHSKRHKHRKHESPNRSSRYSNEKDSSHSRKEKRRRE
ncbi:G patch domain-containing protein TGH-like [Glycine soja]|uniref:G patch domain-containing protein 1 n=1 Tax=Glycine soja TaxID=3848 RepID=A0A0B2PS88_GLYSO|nr:G patch domain-containing protein TGH-like [Glycine soja]KHN10437.1 G patch domain-containing protein 1 [Glycine soja]RZB56568.1 G patch domain-containing protein TGH [Glycine soja]